MDQNLPVTEYKPNLSPIIYWALAYGVIAGVVLFVLYLMSQYLTFLWAPVFLISAAWGAYRNYTKQKAAWYQTNGLPQQKKPVFDEMKEAFQDIADASREVMQEEQPSQEQEAPQPEESEPQQQETPDFAQSSATRSPAGMTEEAPSAPTQEAPDLGISQTEDNPPVPPIQPR